MQSCTNCGAKISTPEDPFCRQCGERLLPDPKWPRRKVCIKCNFPNSLQKPTCANCGADIPLVPPPSHAKRVLLFVGGLGLVAAVVVVVILATNGGPPKVVQAMMDRHNTSEEEFCFVVRMDTYKWQVDQMIANIESVLSDYSTEDDREFVNIFFQSMRGSDEYSYEDVGDYYKWIRSNCF